MGNNENNPEIYTGASDFQRDIFDSFVKWYESGDRLLVVSGPRYCGKTTEVGRLISMKGCEAIHVSLRTETEKAERLLEAFSVGDEEEVLEELGYSFNGSLEDLIIVFDDYEYNETNWKVELFYELFSDLCDKEDANEGCRAILVGVGLLGSDMKDHIKNFITMNTMTYSEVYTQCRKKFKVFEKVAGFSKDWLSNVLYPIYLKLGGYPSVVEKYLAGIERVEGPEELEKQLWDNFEEAYKLLEGIYNEVYQEVLSWGDKEGTYTDMLFKRIILGYADRNHLEDLHPMIANYFRGRCSCEIAAEYYDNEDDFWNTMYSCSGIKHGEIVDCVDTSDKHKQLFWFNDAGIQYIICKNVFDNSSEASETFEKAGMSFDDMLNVAFVLREVQEERSMEIYGNFRMYMNTWLQVIDGKNMQIESFETDDNSSRIASYKLSFNLDTPLVTAANLVVNDL